MISPSKFQSCMTVFHYKNGGCRIYETLFQYLVLDDPKVSWDDGTCKLIHKKCHSKGYHSHITHNTMTLNTIFGVVFVILSTLQPAKSLMEAETEAIPGSSATVEAKFDSR